MIADKPFFRLITDAAESAALSALRKYVEGQPHCTLRAGQLWVLNDENYRAWKAKRMESEHG